MPADLNDYFKKKNGGGNSNSGGGNNFNFQTPQFFKDGGKKMGFLYAIIIIIVLLVVAKPFVIINSGQMGILATMGKFNEKPLSDGIHFFVPILQKVLIVDTKVRIINYTSVEDAGEIIKQGSGIIRKNSISVLDARGLPVSIDLTVQYRLNPDKAPQTIKAWGLSWEDKIINPVVRDVVRSAVGQHTAELLPTKRDEIAKAIDDGIRTDIENQKGQPVQLLTVQLREIILPTKIKEQIERVQIAKQEAERTKYEVERANQEALKKAALAEGTAKARIIEAKGQADAIKIEADANAYENKVISSSLTNNLLELRQIEVQGKFNEALRQNQNAQIFLTPGGSTPNIWLDSKNAKNSTAISQ